MGTDAPHVLIVDSSVLINFLGIDRADLLAGPASQALVTEHVVAEITGDYPEQLQALTRALEAGTLRVLSVNDPNELAEIAALRRSTGNRLGIGECSAIIAASARGLQIAIDDGAAIKHIRRALPGLQIHTTKDLMVAMVRGERLSVEDADSIAATWRTHHSFNLGIRSFGDIP